MWYEKLQKFKWEDGLIVLGLILVAVGIGLNLGGRLKQESGAVVTKNSVVQSDSKVMIDVGGAVLKPGVYELQNGSRINDALIMAGGLSYNADRDWISQKLNKAQILTDGQKLFIPSQQLAQSGGQSVSGVPTGTIKGDTTVSLNSATAEELDTLPGVGPAMASKIIDYREKNGGFKTTDEIKLVPGIGDKSFERLKDLISL